MLPGEDTGGVGAGAIGTLPVRIPEIDPLVFVLLRPCPPAAGPEAGPPVPFLPAGPPGPLLGAMLAGAFPLPPIELRPRASARWAPLARFRFLITSVFSDKGRTTP